MPSLKAYGLALLLLAAFPSCRTQAGEGKAEAVSRLLGQSAAEISRQQYEPALEKALEALETAGEDPLLRVRSLLRIVGVDIMASRDADAWEKALEAEQTARREGFGKELSEALIAKAKLCSYAEISPETARNDEGLAYAGEALALADSLGLGEQEAEACYVIASLYINKNRWSDPIDAALYRKAGMYLDRGQALSDSLSLERLRRNGLLFRSRYLQQGGREEDALAYFAGARKALDAEDHLMASALDDRLVGLYIRQGDSQAALEAHQDYVCQISQYMAQKSDAVLQEMETRFEVRETERDLQLREYQIFLLLLLVLLAAAVIVIVTFLWRRSSRMNRELMAANDVKEQLITLLSNDRNNPAGSYASELEKLSADAASMSPEQIRERCQEMVKSVRTMNEEVAEYVGDVLVERGRRIADIGLSRREIEIIRLSAEGLTAAKIAERLYLSVHTVNTHRQRIYAKMDVKNVSEMLHKASGLGII